MNTFWAAAEKCDYNFVFANDATTTAADSGTETSGDDIPIVEMMKKGGAETISIIYTN